MSAYNLIKGSITEEFSNSRMKIQIFGGGFANGKTAAAVVLKILKVAIEYPGSNILVARSTLPKLNDTIRKEFTKWCPKKWIKSFAQPQKDSSTCILTNGTHINFRYIQQQSRGQQDSSSNLLSATYDLVVVDQVEDPEIQHKDFNDLLGRLRGMTEYAGNDASMPRSGPRWMVLTCNPTGNWFYQKIVRPYHLYMQSVLEGQPPVITDDLLCERDPITRAPLLDENGQPRLLLQVFEGSTYENAQNLESDFIQTLESVYTGQMRDRYLLGQWAAFEGLVYPSITRNGHALRREDIIEHLMRVGALNPATLYEGYDHGIAVPSAYLMGFEDGRGNFFLVDGVYGVREGTDPWVAEIQKMRLHYLNSTLPDKAIEADPAIFRRTGSLKNTIGPTVAKQFDDEGLKARRGNNDFSAGHAKIVKWAALDPNHVHPITGKTGAPHFYIADELTFWWDEVTNYYWKKNTSGEWRDEPQDVNDHAMDAMRYMFTRLRQPFLYSPVVFEDRRMYQWHELDASAETQVALAGAM